MTLTLRDPDLFFTTLSSMMLLDPRPSYVFDQIAMSEIRFGAGDGDTVQLNRYPAFGDNGLSLTARKLTEQQTIGTADPIKQDQESVTVILEEYSGPYNPDAGHVAPLGLTEKVARQAEAKLIDTGDPTSFFNSIGGNSLKDDHDRWHDRVLQSLLDETTNEWNPDDVSDGSTATSGTGSKIDTEDLQGIKETLEMANAPTDSDGLYWAIVSPRMDKHFRQDTDFKEAMHYANPNALVRGEMGVYEGFRFIKSTNMSTETINSLDAYKGFFLGPGAIGYGEGDFPVEIRKNKNDDYERFMYLVWLVFRGYALLDDRFVVEGRTYAS